MLAVVDYQQQRRAAEPRLDDIRRRTSRVEPNRERVGDGGPRRGGCDRGQVDPPHALRERFAHEQRHLGREPRLSRPRGADDRDEPLPADQRPKGGDLRRPADEARHVAGHTMQPTNRSVFQRPVMKEDQALELAKLSSGLEPELLGKEPPRVSISLERVRLPAGPVEREHEPAPEPLAERVLLDGRAKLRDELLVTPLQKTCLNEILEHDKLELLEPLNLVAGEVVVLEPGKRRTANERQGLLEPGGRERRVAGVERVPAPLRQGLEALNVDLPSLDHKPVAAAFRDQGQ
jgi:hypothetical protein